MKNQSSNSKVIFLAVLTFMALGVISACNNSQTKASLNDENGQNGGDRGKLPWVLNIEDATVGNPNYRMTLWTGEHMQLVLMSLKPGESIDLELHNGHDQFFRVEQGEARVRMGKEKENLTFDELIYAEWSIMIPSGYWHEIINTGETDLKLYTIYAPKEHKAGTVHSTYNEAKDDHHDH